jgi:hypothetical protein
MRNHFFWSAGVALAVICAIAFAVGFPVAPFFVITVVAETLFGLRLDNDRQTRFLMAMGHAGRNRLHISHDFRN